MTPRQRALLISAGVGIGVYLLFRKRSVGAMTPAEARQYLSQLSAQIGVEPAVSLAIMQVESGSKGYKNGRLIIRFEPHVFKKRAGVKVVRSGGSQDAQYQALAVASAINRNAALQSISMGSSQVMGFNYALIGYSSPDAMWRAFNISERAHIEGFIAFLKNRKGGKMLKAAQTKNWAKIALYYNGPGGVGIYDPKIAAAYKKWKAKGY